MVLLVLSVFMVDNGGLAGHDRLVVTEAAVQGLGGRDERALVSGAANWNLWEGQWLEGEVAPEWLEVLDLADFAGESLCN